MIIPRPAEAAAHPGDFLLGPRVRLSAGLGAERAAALLMEYLEPLGLDRIGVSVPPGEPGGAGSWICLELAASDGDGPDAAPHGYSLTIRAHRVTLAASGEPGLFHGVQTLRQLLLEGPWRWPGSTVRDAPRLPWRGALLDVARHFMPLDFLYEFVDTLAMHKLNVLHLHLTDDQGWRMEVDGLPRLTEVGAWRTESMTGPAGSGTFDGVPHGGFYTRSELRALVRYADDRGVTIVPEIEMPGHAKSILAAYPELGNRPETRLPVWTEWGISGDLLGVHDEVFEFWRKVIAQVVDVFPSEYIHIGGDECPMTQWQTSSEVRARAETLGLTDPRRLHGWFLRQVRDILADFGRRAICWDESEENGDLDTDLALAAWRDPAHGARAVQRGHQVVMAPHTRTYLDYPQRDHPDEPQGNPKEIVTLEDVYSYDPLEGGLPVSDPSGREAGVLGAQAQLWTEHVPDPEHARYLLFPRLCAFAEVAWGGEERDFAEFCERLDPHLDHRSHGAVRRDRPDPA